METLPVEKLFSTVGMVAVGTGLLFFVFSRPIKRLASDVR
jgi:hypothetical protein